MLTKSRVLFWVGLLCFVPFFFPTIQHNQIPNGTENKFTLGVPASPWLVASWTETKVEIKDGMSSSFSSHFAHSFNVELITWSSLFAIAGTALIMASRRLKAKEAAKG